jgi:hypothetical protein
LKSNLRSFGSVVYLAALLLTACGGAKNDAGDPQATPPAHVLTAEYLGGNGGYMGPAATMGAYASWASGANPTQVHSAAMKVYAYTNPNRANHSDNDYRITNLLDDHQGAIAKNCAGAPITTSHGDGILTDVRLSEAIGHATDLVEHVNLPGTDAVFMDDTANVQYTDNGLPCGYTADAWLAGTQAMYSAQTASLIFNGLNLAEYGVNVLPLADLKNVIGGMWTGCYAFHREFGYSGDGVDGLAQHWSDTENAELAMAAKGKMFWCFNTARDPGSASIPLRTYAYASFLLTYDPSSSLYQTQMATPSNLRIFPETGLVPSAPSVAAPSAVTSLQTSSGAYGREFAACYYRGAPVGACAVIVNPDTAPHANAYAVAYTRTVVLRGAGVIDGGSVATNGPVPATLGPHTAAILIK